MKGRFITASFDCDFAVVIDWVLCFFLIPWGDQRVDGWWEGRKGGQQIRGCICVCGGREKRGEGGI